MCFLLSREVQELKALFSNKRVTTPPVWDKTRKKQVRACAFVINENGEALSPCHLDYARHLVRCGCAHFVPFSSPYKVICLHTKNPDIRIRGHRLQIMLKDGGWQIALISRKKDYTLISPFNFSSLDTDIKAEIEKIMMVCHIDDIRIVYHKVEDYDTLDILYMNLYHVFSGVKLSRRSFLQKETAKTRQKIKKGLQKMEYRLGELFTGLYASRFEGIEELPTGWYLPFCSEFVDKIYTPYVRRFSKQIKIPDHIRFRSRSERIREVACRFYRMNFVMQHQVLTEAGVLPLLVRQNKKFRQVSTLQ